MHDWTFHGGQVQAAQKAYPDAPRPWIDLSTGINPIAFPADGICANDWAALPDAGALAKLEEAAGASFGLNLAECRPIAIPGTEIGIRLLSALGLPAPYRYVAPGYRSHAEAFAEVSAVRADMVEAEADNGGTILLANPNNPDGRSGSPALLKTIAARLAERQGMLIIDEAFADVMPEISLLPTLEDGPQNIIVLRSFGKFFGLAGLRLGFMVAPDPWQARIRHLLGSWPVSAAAIRIGTNAYRDNHWTLSTRKRLAADAARLDALLLQYGLQAIGTCPLFRLIETSEAGALFETLMHHAILTRPFDYARNWLRFGLPGSDVAWSRLEQALVAAHG